MVFLAWDDSSHITAIELFADSTFAQVQAINNGGGRCLALHRAG